MTDETERPLLVLGTRTFAEEVADLAAETPGWRVAGFVENMDRARAGERAGLPVYWIDDIGALAENHWAVCGLATTHRSRFTNQVAALGLRFATIVHPTARVSSSAALGEGTVVSVAVVVASQTTLGRHVIVNRGALIGHHSEIGDYATVQPGANIAGACRICEGAYIGMGAVVIDHISIGAHSIVGAGAVVTKDVPANVQVVGVPARIVREHVEGK